MGEYKTERNAQLYNGRMDGMTISELMKKYDMSYAKVHRILKNEEVRRLRKKTKQS